MQIEARDITCFDAQAFVLRNAAHATFYACCKTSYHDTAFFFFFLLLPSSASSSPLLRFLPPVAAASGVRNAPKSPADDPERPSFAFFWALSCALRLSEAASSLTSSCCDEGLADEDGAASCSPTARQTAQHCGQCAHSNCSCLHVFIPFEQQAHQRDTGHQTRADTPPRCLSAALAFGATKAASLSFARSSSRLACLASCAAAALARFCSSDRKYSPEDVAGD